MKAEGRRQKAEGRKQSRRKAELPCLVCLPPSAYCLLLTAFCLLVFSSCAVDERRSGLPPGAQAAIDRLTEQYAERRFAEIYAEAADEWRAAATEDQSRATLE